MQNLSYLVVHNFFGEHMRVQFHSRSRFFEPVVVMVLAQVWVPVQVLVSFPAQEVEVEEQARARELALEQEQVASLQA